MPTLQATNIAFAPLYLNFHTVRFFMRDEMSLTKIGILQ